MESTGDVSQREENTQRNTEQSQRSQKKEKQPYKLKRGQLEVIGYTQDSPMCIKIKVTLPSGQIKSVCK